MSYSHNPMHNFPLLRAFWSFRCNWRVAPPTLAIPLSHQSTLFQPGHTFGGVISGCTLWYSGEIWGVIQPRVLSQAACLKLGGDVLLHDWSVCNFFTHFVHTLNGLCQKVWRGCWKVCPKCVQHPWTHFWRNERPPSCLLARGYIFVYLENVID